MRENRFRLRTIFTRMFTRRFVCTMDKKWRREKRSPCGNTTLIVNTLDYCYWNRFSCWIRCNCTRRVTWDCNIRRIDESESNKCNVNRYQTETINLFFSVGIYVTTCWFLTELSEICAGQYNIMTYALHRPDNVNKISFSKTYFILSKRKSGRFVALRMNILFSRGVFKVFNR